MTNKKIKILIGAFTSLVLVGGIIVGVSISATSCGSNKKPAPTLSLNKIIGGYEGDHAIQINSSVDGGQFTIANGTDPGITVSTDGKIIVDTSVVAGEYSINVQWTEKGYKSATRLFQFSAYYAHKLGETINTSTVIHMFDFSMWSSADVPSADFNYTVDSTGANTPNLRLSSGSATGIQIRYNPYGRNDGRGTDIYDKNTSIWADDVEWTNSNTLGKVTWNSNDKTLSFQNNFTVGTESQAISGIVSDCIAWETT